MQPLTPEPQGAGLGAPPIPGVVLTAPSDPPSPRVTGVTMRRRRRLVIGVTGHLTCGFVPIKSPQTLPIP
jgi:hypothetical protein